MDALLRGRSRCDSYRALVTTLLELGLQSRTLREIATAGTFEGLLGLRHDVDHYLERAVLMGLIEHDLGVRATYFLLPPGDYDRAENYYGRLVGDHIERRPSLVSGAHALIELGHEIGLHNDFIQLSLRTGRPPEAHLREEIAFFKDNGIEIVGSAAHGSSFARKNNFANYELFSKCTREPASVYVDREGELQAGRTIQVGSFQFPLNSVDMEALGLTYEAYFLSKSCYLSDVGSQLTLNSQPIEMFAPETAVEIFYGSGQKGVQALVHADHWIFRGDTHRGLATLETIRAADHYRSGSTPPILSLEYLEEWLVELKSNPLVRFLRYDDLSIADEPKADPGERAVMERTLWDNLLAEGRFDASHMHYLIQYNADDDPDAIGDVLALHRKLGIPYSLMTFSRWSCADSGLIEPYPLDWAALKRDSDHGLGSIGYLANALHLSDGDHEAAAREFDADVLRIREFGLPCRVFMPWGRSMPSAEMTHPVFIDWWQVTNHAPLWTYNRFGIRFDGHYVDTVIPDALAGRGALEPKKWTASQGNLPGRRLLLLHPHYYSGHR